MGEPILHPILRRELAFSLPFLARRLRSRLELELADDGLAIEASLIMAVCDDLEGLSQAALAERTGLDRSTTSSTLALLEEEGLVRRARDPGDRRRQLVGLTARGRAAMEFMSAARERAERAALGNLSRRERERLRQLVERALPSRRAPLRELWHPGRATR